MEIKRSGIKMTQQIAWSTSDGHVLGHVRSYRCSFCKRGFSNAQALGGHMNIHRKDRARLKGSSDETSFSMDQDFTKKNHSSPPTAFSNDDLLQLDTSHDHDVHEKSCAHKRPWIFSEEDEESPRRKYCYKQVVQLPFFVEKSYTSNDFGTSSFGDGCVGKKHGSSNLELDLELRLGPEPQDSPCINKR